MALNIDALKSKIEQPTSRLTIPNAKQEEQAAPKLPEVKNPRAVKLSAFTEAASTPSDIRKIVDTHYKAVDPANLRKTMFHRAATYYSMPDELKPVAANGFIQSYNAYNSALSDPSSPLYSPYNSPTNYKAIEGLAQYGYDATAMSEDELRELTQYRRTTATGYSAAAPTKSSSAAENAAYWAQEYLEANERTSTAETELAAMQKAVDYYVNELGLSDSEIVQRINASSEYPTLKKMMDSRDNPLLMNRAIDYNGEDTVYGMIFAARNGGQSLGSYGLNAGAYAAGYGTQYEDDGGVARRDAGNLDTYNPYVGTTLEALGLKYGVNAFTPEWLAENRDMLATAAPGDLKKIDAAIATSTKAEEEYADLQDWARRQAEAGKSPDEIKAQVAERLERSEYKTLAQMEEGRRIANPIAMGYGVNFTRSEFDRYIDSLFAEQAQETALEGYSLSSYYNNGGDGNILHNEVARWLNGRGTTTEEGQAFVDEYGWLFGGETGHVTSTGERTYDSRLYQPRGTGFFSRNSYRPTGLGNTAYELLDQAQEAAANGYISTDDYVTFGMAVAQEMENAEAAGMSMEDYLSSGMGSLPDISTVIEEGRAEKEARDDERKRTEALAVQTMLEETDAAVANGTATPDQIRLHNMVETMSIDEATANSPELAAERADMAAGLREYAHNTMMGNLEAVYGDMDGYASSVRDAEARDSAAAIVNETATNVSEIALGYYDADVKRASIMGISLEAYYELYPERRLSTEEAYARAYADYTNTWSPVWSTIEREAQLRANSPVEKPVAPLAEVLAESEQEAAAYNEAAAVVSEQPAPVEYGEGVGAIQTVKSAAASGGYAAAYGTLDAVHYFVTSGNDYVLEIANRNTYNNDPAAYRKALEEGIATLPDPEEREAWQYMLDNWTGDIFSLTFGFDDARVRSAMHAIQQHSTEIDQFMQENGTAAENVAYRYMSNAVTNSIYLVESGVLSTLGLPGAMSAALVYGAPAGAEMGQRLEAAGLDETAAKGAALGWASIVGWLENSTLGEFLPNAAGKTGTSLLRRGISALGGKPAGKTAKVLEWLIAPMASEGTQEGVEYVAGSAYESVFTAYAGGANRFTEYVAQITRDMEGDEFLDNVKMGALSAPLLGLVGAGYGKVQTGAQQLVQRKPRSVQIAEQIVDNGGATAAEVREFAAAVEEDMQDPAIVEQIKEAAIEQMTAEEVVSAMLRNSLAPEVSAQLAESAKRSADLRRAVADAQSDVSKAETESAQYKELLGELTQQYIDNPADPTAHDAVIEMTQLVARADAEVIKAREKESNARRSAEEASVELVQYRQRMLETARAEAPAAVVQTLAEESEASAKREEFRGRILEATTVQTAKEAPVGVFGTPMPQRNSSNISDKSIAPFVVEHKSDEAIRDYFAFAAELLAEDLADSTPGQRFMLGDGSWTGQKRSTTPEIASLLDNGISYEKLSSILTAFQNHDIAYLTKNKQTAKKVELVLDGMLADGYTTIRRERVEPYLGYREYVGYPARTQTTFAEDEDLPFYQGRSIASRQAEQAAKTQKADLESPVRVMEDLSKELGFGQYTGPRGSEARFAMFSEYMQVNTMHASDYWRKAHEIGHGLSKTLNMTATDEMVSSGVFNNTPQEAFAEFVAVYMGDRNTAVQFAGEPFVRDFEGRMIAAGVYKPVNKAATQMRAYFAANAEQKVSASVVNRSDTKRKETERLRRAITMHVDHAFAGRKVDKIAGNPEYGLEDAMHYREYHKRLAQLCLESRLVNWNNDSIGESWASMLANNGITADNVNDLVIYKLALHGLDRAAAGKPVFGENTSEADMLEIVNGAAPEIVAASDAWDAWWDKFVRGWLVDSGVVTREDYDSWREQYAHYVPTVRDMGGESLIMQRDGAGSWTFHAAKGSALDIINPLDSIVEYVGSIVTRVAQNTVAQKFDQLYQQTEGMGIFAKAVPVPEGDVDTTTVDTLGGGIYSLTQRPDVLVVSREDGSRVAYQFADRLLLEALRSNGPKSVEGILRAAQILTRNMSAIVTSADPTFGVKNAMRDEAKAVAYGSFATTEFDGGAKWAQSLARVAAGKGSAVEEYENLGGGGWNRVDTGSGKGRAEIRSSLIEGYKGESGAERAYLAAKKVLNVLTMERMNEVLEQTTRVTEFDSAQNRELRQEGIEGRRKAFLASQDVTLDFAHYGLSKSYSQLKAIIPFYGPSVQSLYQQADTIATAFGKDVPEADRKQAIGRIVRTATTYGLRAAIQVALTKLAFDDEERMAYDMLSDEIKGQNLIIPTRWLKEPLVALGVFDDSAAERMFIRIPTAQGILDNTLYAGFLDSMSNLADVDEASINFLDVANRVVLGSLPVDVSGFATDWETGISGMFSSSILAVPAAIMANRNWYGSPIVSESLADLPKIYQYNETTPTLFVEMSKAFDGKVSPLVLQYVAEQYTGFYGKILIPFLSRDQATGKWDLRTSFGNVVRKAVSGYTIEPLYSNDISGAYYDNRDVITGLVSTPDGYDLPGIRTGANMDDAREAAEDLEKYFAEQNTEIKALTKEINEINADASMTRAERAMAVREPTMERLRLMEEANTAYGEYMAKYGTQGLWERWFSLEN